MPEKYYFSEDKSGDIFRQLPPEEKEAVIGAAQEEMAEIHKKAHALAGEGEKPTARHYSTAAEAMADKQEASEQINASKKQKKQKKIVLTPEQKREMIMFVSSLSYGSMDNAYRTHYRASLPKEVWTYPEIQQATRSGFINCLSRGDTYNLKRIESEYYLLSEKIALPEVQLAARKGYINCLINGQIQDALEIKDKFSINMQPDEIIAELPKLAELLSKLDIIMPGFSEQAHRSLDLVMSLCEALKDDEKFIQTIQENPFLLDAVSENPRFGSKLLIKYPQFDELSKENIETLFDAKKEILANNPDIEPTSLEFRQLMQEKLKEYKNNPEILKAIQESGINIDEWLNYSETKYFNLEAGDSHLVFSETIQAPINRIKETLDSYAHTLKNVLKEYKPELSEFKIPLEDAKETEEKIVKMQAELEKARAEGNDKKAQGIEKGIEGLKSKIGNIKTVAVWDKLLGDISAFQQLKNDVFSAQEKLMQAENDLQEKLSGKLPSGKMIQESKEKINKAKEELRRKFSVLETRIENFKTNLLPLISPALGKERSEALIQEIEQNLAEQFDHWNTGRRDLTNLFSERGDREKGRLENQPMSIFVWARNPDIDLYQGNYSPCCICIDSAHMGAESTIADYNTDLGIQIVNIWDETKNEPITATWCWLGQDESGETVLVVDNIESNFLYSANYSEQLTKELFDYLENYAKAIGAKKIVLGKANNDLPTAGELAKMPENDEQYDKIGGYNRVDGYFLEAEDKSVKVVWKEKESKEYVAEKKTERIKKVEFADLNIRNLAEKDFSTIKQLERKIYAGTDLISGQAMIEDIKGGNGLEYSVVIVGKARGEKSEEIIGYIAAVEDEMNDGDACVYLEDIAITPEAQGQGIGWEMLKNFISKLKEKARRDNKPVLLDMHLRENSQRFMERHRANLEQMGVRLIENEEALVPNYYDEGEDALYQVYEVKPDEG